MKNVFNESCPETTHSINKDPRWRSADLAQLKKQLRKLASEARKTNNTLDWNNGKVCREHYKCIKGILRRGRVVREQRT